MSTVQSQGSPRFVLVLYCTGLSFIDGGSKEPKAVTYLVTNATKDSKLPIIVALRGCGIVKAPVDAFCITGKDWAVLVGLVANCNHIVELLSRELINRFRTMFGDVDANLAYSVNGFTPNAAGFDARL